MNFAERLNQSADSGLQLASRSPGTPVTGAVMIDIEPKMQQIRVSADALNDDVQKYVADANFKKHWMDWYASWQKYYDDTHGLWTRLFSNPLHADAIDKQVEAFRLNLIGWYESYVQQKTVTGAPVPAPSGQPPLPGREPEKGTSAAGLPWWFWLLSGVAVVGLGYIIYRKVEEGRAKAAYAHKYAPGILERYLGPLGKPAYEYTQAGRDPRGPNFILSRDPDAIAPQFQLSNYTRDPSPMMAVHRGFPVHDLRVGRDEAVFEQPQFDLPRPPREAPRRAYDPYGYDLAHDVDGDDYL